jgi:hypothetical protein
MGQENNDWNRKIKMGRYNKSKEEGERKERGHEKR